MDVLITVVAYLLALALLISIWILPSKLRRFRELPQKSRLELEQLVFRYAQDYFRYIGHEHPEVIAFRRLIETKDLKGLLEQWGELSTSFVRLETKAGWRGRPLIMDYYYDYEEDLAALAKL